MKTRTMIIILRTAADIQHFRWRDAASSEALINRAAGKPDAPAIADADVDNRGPRRGQTILNETTPSDGREESRTAQRLTSRHFETQASPERGHDEGEAPEPPSNDNNGRVFYGGPNDTGTAQ
jgi:hypothetical protein